MKYNIGDNVYVVEMGEKLLSQIIGYDDEGFYMVEVPIMVGEYQVLLYTENELDTYNK